MPFQEFEETQKHMATTFALSIACEPAEKKHAEKILLACHRLIHQIELQLSEYIEGSPVHAFNKASVGEKIIAPAHLQNILKESKYIELKSNGAFNIRSKSLEPGEIIFSQCGEKISKSVDGLKIGFGAIGKGYALDQARVLIEAAGFTNYLLNAGGSSILISGFGNKNQPWRWAWSWAKNSQGYIGKEFLHSSGKRVALGVSGTMEQGFHIQDPLLKKTAESTLSAIVANELASRADGFSTALFVNGWKNLEAFQDPNYFSAIALVDRDENIFWNGTFQQTWGPVCS